MSHYIETASTSLRNGDRIVDPVAASIVELVKLIIGDSNSTKTTDENTAVTVVDENTNQPQTNGDNKVSLTYDELSKLFSNFADKNRYYVGVSFPLNWDNIFPSMIAEAAESVSPSVHLSITEIIENARG
jgi:hypothetical protein